jgi:hypothetical protein
MNFKRKLYLVLVVLLVSSVLRINAITTLAGPDPMRNRIYSVASEISACNSGTGWLTVTVISDATPSGYNSVTAHAVGSPDTFIFDVPNSVSPYMHDIRYTAPKGSSFIVVELKLWWTDLSGSTLVESAQFNVLCTGASLPPSNAGDHANSQACADNPGRANFSSRCSSCARRRFVCGSSAKQ